MSTAITPERDARRPAWAGRAIVVAAFVAATAVPALRFLTAGDERGATPVPRPQTTEQQLATLRQRVISSPDDGAAWLTLAQVSTQEAVRSADPALYETARQAVTEARRLRADDPRTSVVDGVLALSLHEFGRAYNAGLEATRANPASSDAAGVLVDASVELGRYDEAAGHVQDMLDRRPGSAALARASYLRELRGDLPGAILAMEQALSAASGNPADTAALAEFLGNLQLTAGDLDSAASAFDRSLELSPERVGSTLGRAKVSAARGDRSGAIALAATVAERSSQPAAAVVLGELRLIAGDQAGADEAFALMRANEQLLAAAGVNTELESALFEADHGDPDRAVTLARTAYDGRQTVFTAEALGWALTKAGRATEAIPFVESSLALGTASASLRVHAAAAFAAAGQPARASDELRAAFSLSPWPSPWLRTVAATLAEDVAVQPPPAWSA